MFIETSAKDGDNVKKLFREVATSLPGSDQAGPSNKKLVQVVLEPVSFSHQFQKMFIC